MTGHDERSMLVTAQEMLVQHALCDRCLGRQFAWLGTGTSNEARGYSIKLTLCMVADDELKSGNKELGERAIAVLADHGMFAPAKTIATKNSIKYEDSDSCHLCFIEGHSIFDRIPNVAERMIGIADQVEFETFLAGSIPSPILVERQDEITATHSTLHSETLKSHFNRLMGIQLQELLKKPVDFEKPDVVFVYDMDQDEVDLQVNPVFIYGRYRGNWFEEFLKADGIVRSVKGEAARNAEKQEESIQTLYLNMSVFLHKNTQVVLALNSMLLEERM